MGCSPRLPIPFTPASLPTRAGTRRGLRWPWHSRTSSSRWRQAAVPPSRCPALTCVGSGCWVRLRTAISARIGQRWPSSRRGPAAWPDALMVDSHQTRPDVHTPVTLLTGFLGSGKTTLLNRALRDPEMAGTLIVINEFGAIPIDHALTEASNDAIVVLENGCLCCTVFGDLVQTFNRLYHARAAGEVAFDHVVIETSGLAEPAPVLQAFLSEPTLEGLYRVASVLTLVDAVNWPGTSKEHDESVRQVALADQIRITKLDLVAGDAEMAAT